MVLRFESLIKTHNHLDFDCGEEALNLYIRQFAQQDIHRELARTFIIREEENYKVLGYYTLCSGAIDVKDLSHDLHEKLPRYPLPVARLARLAVDKKQQGKSYGKLLLVDALYRTVTAGESMGIYGLIIDAKHEKALQFYQRYGFQSVTLNPLLLFSSLENLRNQFETSKKQ